MYDITDDRKEFLIKKGLTVEKAKEVMEYMDKYYEDMYRDEIDFYENYK